MPGLAVADMSASPSHGVHVHQLPVKSEAEEPDDFLPDEDADAQGSEDSYKSCPQLPQPGTFLRTLDFLMTALDAGEIDINPDYQREVVWTADRMTCLVNSLQENFYIPPIILNKKARPTEIGEDKHTLVCIDGKQRLSSVRAFIKGIIPCIDHRGDKWWFNVTHHTPTGRKKKVLSEKDRQAFIRKEFVTFEYAELSQEQEEDLFARVQMGVQLTMAEKMRASTGPWQELTRCYVDDYPVIYSLLKDRTRAKDFQMTLSCFSQIVEVRHPTAPSGIPALKTNYHALPKLIENKSAVDDGIKSHFASVWNTFQNLIELDPNTFTNADKHLRGVQTFAPLEVVAVTVLISVYSESRNNRLLLGDIKALRETLREKMGDLRLNVTAWKTVWEFIDNLEQIRGSVDGSTVDRRIAPGQAPVRAPVPEPPSPSAKRGRPTARTKTVTVLPGSRDIKLEPVTTTLPADPRPLKRPRTEIVQGSDPARAPKPKSANTINSSRAISSPMDSSDDVEFLYTVSKPSSPTNGPPSTVPITQMQTNVVPPGPAVSSPNRKSAQESRPGRSVEVAFVTNNSATQHSTPAGPSEARRDYISQLNSYRAPVAPMGSGTAKHISKAPPPTAPMGTTRPPSTSPAFLGNINWSLPTRSTPPLPNNTPATRPSSVQKTSSSVPKPTATKPFFASGPVRPLSSPSHEITRDVSPTLAGTNTQHNASNSNSGSTQALKRPSQIQNISTPRSEAKAPPVQARPNPASRPTAPSRPIAYDGAIDLTSDDEQEGEDLLALFGARASLEKSTGKGAGSSDRSFSSPGARHPPSSLKHRPSKLHSAELDLAEAEYLEYNNPYERRMQQAGGTRS